MKTISSAEKLNDKVPSHIRCWTDIYVLNGLMIECIDVQNMIKNQDIILTYSGLNILCLMYSS